VADPSKGKRLGAGGCAETAEGGKIVEDWDSCDNLSFMQQLGLAPALPNSSRLGEHRARGQGLAASALSLALIHELRGIPGSLHTLGELYHALIT
jgi:hypothetical protein